MTSTDREGAARELLAFYREAGVDALLEETPTDRFASDRPSAVPAPRAEAARAKGEASSARPGPMRERELPGRVAAAVAVSPEAAVMVAREAAFVGRSGKLLDRMMAAIGLDRTSAYIANIVPWRPPGNRTPTPQESAICLPFTLRQIELADPDILICLGNPSTQTLLNSKDGILKTRGRWFPFHTGTREIRAMATLHPAYLLRQPLQKRLAWRDFLAIKKALAT